MRPQAAAAFFVYEDSPHNEIASEQKNLEKHKDPRTKTVTELSLKSAASWDLLSYLSNKFFYCLKEFELGLLLVCNQRYYHLYKPESLLTSTISSFENRILKNYLASQDVFNCLNFTGLHEILYVKGLVLCLMRNKYVSVNAFLFHSLLP